jgi:preprotein translocase subunit SecF
VSGEAVQHSIWSRLSHGETNLNIVGRWKRWFAISGVVIVVGLVALAVNGLNLGIDFTGGTVWEVPAGDADVADVEQAIGELGYDDVKVQEITVAGGEGDGRVLRVQAEAKVAPDAETTDAVDAAVADLEAIAEDTKGESRAELEAAAANLSGVEGPFPEPIPEELAAITDEVSALAEDLPDAEDRTALVATATATLDDQIDALIAAEKAERQALGAEVSERLAELTGSDVSDVTVDTVGPSWGDQISQKARNALIVFLLAIALYITLRFEFKMAVATLAALVHDLLVVIGIYAIFQFPVTPATVIALLTILGFSIYDGIVVFDRVDENTKLLGRKSKLTYSDMANLSLNQVLMRSLNTSITALLPIATVLILGSFVLGATTLEEFGLALFLGLLSGAYSSLFIATPLLALLKEREPRNRELRERQAQGAAPTTASGDGDGDADTEPVTVGGTRPAPAGVAPAGSAPRPRKQGKKR